MGNWPDTARLSRDELVSYIRTLEAACAEQPASADLLTCLGVAHAALERTRIAHLQFERAIQADPGHFYARYHFAKLLLQLRQIDVAKEQCSLAVNRARTRAESAMARRLLHEIETATQAA